LIVISRDKNIRECPDVIIRAFFFNIVAQFLLPKTLTFAPQNRVFTI